MTGSDWGEVRKAVPGPAPSADAVIRRLDVATISSHGMASRVGAALRNGGGEAADVVLMTLTHQQLRDLITHLLAAPPDETPAPALSDASGAAICHAAVTATAATTGTTPEAILGPGRSQPIADARAVAMTAARRTGLTLSVIGDHFGRDHSSVLHAVRRVGQDPRLHAIADNVARQLRHGPTPREDTRPTGVSRPERCGFPGCGRPATPTTSPMTTEEVSANGRAGPRAEVYAGRCAEHGRVRLSRVGSWVDDHHQQGGHG